MLLQSATAQPSTGTHCYQAYDRATSANSYLFAVGFAENVETVLTIHETAWKKIGEARVASGTLALFHSRSQQQAFRLRSPVPTNLHLAITEFTEPPDATMREVLRGLLSAWPYGAELALAASRLILAYRWTDAEELPVRRESRRQRVGAR